MLTLALTCSVHAADPLDSAIRATLEANQQAARTQQRVDTLAGETRALLDEYRSLVQQLDDAEAYNEELEHLVQQQQVELTAYAADLGIARKTRDRIAPLMHDMVRTLKDLIDLDLPFLAGEREARIADLEALLDDVDVAPTDKFQRIMDAYMIEADYGRSIEAWSEPLEIAGQTRTVDVLRVGRVALFYVTFDRSESGYRDRVARTWLPLPREYNHLLARALKVARKQAPPEMLIVPLAVPAATP